MFKDIVASFYQGLIPSYINYVLAEKSGKAGLLHIRGPAMQATSLLYHYREELILHYDKTSLSVNVIEQYCPDYELLRDVQNAIKHRFIRRPEKLIEDASSIFETLAITAYEDERGVYTQTVPKIYIKLLAGGVRDLLQINNNVINFWGYFLMDNELVKDFKEFPNPIKPATRNQTDKESSVTVSYPDITSNQLNVTLQVYNYTTGMFDISPELFYQRMRKINNT